MKTVQIRKQGGAAVMTLPADILKMLHLQVGSVLNLEVRDNALTVTAAGRARRRYSLAELLDGIPPEETSEMNAATEWFRAGEPVGRELI